MVRALFGYLELQRATTKPPWNAFAWQWGVFGCIAVGDGGREANAVVARDRTVRLIAYRVKDKVATSAT